MTEVLRKPATLTLLVAHTGTLAAPNAATFVAGADEIIEVSAYHAPLLQHTAPATFKYRHVVSKNRQFAHALNLGVSLAASEWVVLSFGDEAPVSGWLDTIRRHVAEPGASCIQFFDSGSGAQIPLVVVKRIAFVYGAFDERFACGRLAALHWALRTFARPAQRMLENEGVTRHQCALMEKRSLPMVESPLVALTELWGELAPPLRAALLEQVLNTPDETRRALSVLLDAARREAAAAEDPYRSGRTYEAKHFWEANSTDYIRWEIYQPDEPEILALMGKVTPRAVLELGCGAGRNTRYFTTAKHYAGIDLSMNLLRRATERQESNSLGILCGDITVLPFADAAFDLVFSDSTVQHVTPDRIGQCVAEIVRVCADYVCVIEYTEEASKDGKWFGQIHMFAHDYRRLFEPYCELVWHTDTALRVHPARKEVFLFRKRQRG